jgi:Bacteriocin-protection, YdeI or OmpD-Associated
MRTERRLPTRTTPPSADGCVLRVEEGLQFSEERAGLGGVDEVSGVYGDTGAVSHGRCEFLHVFLGQEAAGSAADHEGRRIRARLLPSGSGWVLTLAPKRLLGMGVAIGDDVTVELAPEGPQRSDLADDIAAALEANPAAGAFFDTLAQFYRKAYLRWIDATSRRPDVRAARIAEVVDLLAAGIKERPRA